MIFFRKALYVALCLCAFDVQAGSWSNTPSGSTRSFAGVTRLAHTDRTNDHEYHFPLSGSLKDALSYQFDTDTVLTFSAEIRGKTSTGLDNLNQGHWGEYFSLNAETAYGELSVGQMPNVAERLGVNRPNFPTEQITPAELSNFIDNPNWTQRRRIKYYNTLTSTLIDTDGSSPKISYLTPEFKNTTLAVSYVPENNSGDALTSKFAPYAKKDAFVSALYHHFEFDFADTEFYMAYADYLKSHREYAGGASIYRKGWTLFGSYRQTETHSSSEPIATKSLSSETLAGYDGFRRGKAFNTGLGYEWAFYNGALSYFESRSDTTHARNRIVQWNNTFRPTKNFLFFLGTAWVAFRPNTANEEKRGLVWYGGLEFQF